MADLAIVIVSYNSAQWLVPCLRSLYARAGDVTLDVVVVDNDSADGSADLVESQFPQVRVLRVENRGFAYGNNRGVLASDAAFVLFINADTEILHGTLAEMVQAMVERPTTGLVGCRQVTPDGTLWPTIRRFPNAGRSLFEALGSERFPFRASWLGERELDEAVYEREFECDWTSGSFMLARREALLAAGLMDERFFLYCEEPDLCLRIKRAGYDIRHLPTMTILHHAGKAGWNPRLVAQDAYARRQYIGKHFSGPHRAAALAAFTLAFALRWTTGGTVAEERAARRAASWEGLKTLFGLVPPPFTEPPAQCLKPIESSSAIGTNA